MKQRRRVKHIVALEDRLVNEARRLKDEANTLPPGKAREELLGKARQAEAAAGMNNWLTRPASQRDG